MKLPVVLAGATLIAGAAVAAPLPKPASFAVCGVCHQVDAAKPSGIGPNLWGVNGRVSGTLAGYAYSPAMKAAKVKWDKASLDAYLTAPQKHVPGTKMAYAGQADAAKRAEIVSYVLSLK